MKTFIVACLLALIAVSAVVAPAAAGSPPGHTGYAGR